MNLAKKTVLLCGRSNSGKTTRLKRLVIKILRSKKSNIKIMFLSIPRKSKLSMKNNILYTSKKIINNIINVLQSEVNNINLAQLDYVLILLIGKKIIGIGMRGDNENIFVKDYYNMMNEKCTEIFMACNLHYSIKPKKLVKSVVQNVNTAIYGCGDKKQKARLVDKLYSEI